MDDKPNSNVESRLSRVEVAMESLHEDVSGIKNELRSIAASVNNGFSTMRQEQVQSKQVNWGWIAAFVAVGVAIVGAVTTALVQPLQTFDAAVKERMLNAELLGQKSYEHSIRNDERLKSVEREEDRRRSREATESLGTTPRGQ
jgi:hypothetical protein